MRPPPVPGLVLAILGALRPGCRPPGAASQRAPPHHRRDMRPGTGPPGPFQAPLPHQRMGALHTATADGRAAGMGPGRGQPGPPLRHIAPTLPHGGGGRASVALYGAARPTPLCQPLTRTRGGIAEVILRGMWRCRALSNFRTNGALSLWVHRAKNENAVLQHVNPHPMVPGVAYRKVAAFDPFVIDSCGGISSSFCTVISLALNEYFCNDQPCFPFCSSYIVLCTMSQDSACLQDFSCGFYSDGQQYIGACYTACLQNGRTGGE